jgi:Rps23 Pro-64 3,4-dihydroxylase Tpa1-like proline 4-hydroxylase
MRKFLIPDIESIIHKNLTANKLNLSDQWNASNSTNTKFFFLDDLLPNDLVNKIYQNFPDQSSSIWRKVDTFREKKSAFAKINTLDEIIINITDAFHSKEVIGIVQEICGINDLEADPSLYAGGISMMQTGDFLNPHIDNSHDGMRKRYRRLNLLYYVSPNWDSSCGGNFELWDKNVIEPTVLLSNYNRLIVMETNHQSWHSVNKVVSCNPRYCVSNYYFSKSSPKNEKEYYHPTSFLGRPSQKFLRAFCRLDNLLRHGFTALTGIRRGKKLTRYSS